MYIYILYIYIYIYIYIYKDNSFASYFSFPVFLNENSARCNSVIEFNKQLVNNCQTLAVDKNPARLST